MKCLTKKIDNVMYPILEVEVRPKILFIKPKVKKFQAIELITKNYWHWVELPSNLRVKDSLSFQLDDWLNIIKLGVKTDDLPF